jgi:hypothetical protein
MIAIFHVLFIVFTGLSAIAMPPSTGAATSTNPEVYVYPNEDCIISRLPQTRRGACRNPQECHNAGGLCLARIAHKNIRCIQGVLDATEPYGYSKQTWMSLKASDEIRKDCFGCQCTRTHVRPYTRKARSKHENKKGATSAQMWDSSSTDRSSSSVDEWRGSPWRDGSSSSRDDTRDSSSTGRSSSSVDEGKTPNQAMAQEPQHIAESEDDSHPPLFSNPAHFNPNYLRLN